MKNTICKQTLLFIGTIFYFLAASHTTLANDEPGASGKPTALPEAQLQYFGNLFSLCGARFEGEMTYPQEGQDSFAGKLLVATFAKCSNQEVQIPFQVGENTSRTWVLKKTLLGIELKHDHRHADGTPDEITMYGGTTLSDGTELTQSFPADAYTAELIPEASTNVWSLSFDKDFSTLTYHLTRHDKPRFTAVLKRVNAGKH